MGLTTWKTAPKGRILKSDTTIAKNYLAEVEVKKLERSVGAFFDYIEIIIEKRTSFVMQEFADSVDKFLAFNEYEILSNKGTVSQKMATKKAHEEYEIYNKYQKIESDFDKEIQLIIKGKK